MMKEIHPATRRGPLLDGVLFQSQRKKSDTVVVAITGIHGNFYSNPFYYNIGETLNSGGIDFIYAQTNDAFPQIRTPNILTGKEEIIGSWNERFAYTDDDIGAYLGFVQQAGYRHIYLAGHSLGANKVISYLSRHHDMRVEKFIFLSPANLGYMMRDVTEDEKAFIRAEVKRGRGDRLLPFPFMGWVECIADTACDWLSGSLDNVHTGHDEDFTQAACITHAGALLIGTLDRFTDGDPAGFLENLNSHLPTKTENRLLFIEGTGHTYQGKEQQVADLLLDTVSAWRKG
ncbi:MAG: DUF1749 domain-containing protein [Victivallales bacterium]|nr:DUF1749 domain-containing protein [Victivallales bacterium]